LHFDENSYVDKAGMRVVVGHYVGGTSGGNLSNGKLGIIDLIVEIIEVRFELLFKYFISMGFSK
jgi:hypothetical protein